MPKKKNQEEKKKSRRISLIRDVNILYPELWLHVYIAPENKLEESLIARLFVKGKCYKANSVDEADIVVFGGGADVNPAIYEAEQHPYTNIDIKRDDEDIKLFRECLEKGVPMIGICRGAQFLHVMNGGRLYQHVNNHTGDHAMYIDSSFSKNKIPKTITRVSSVHHQMCIQNSDMTVIGTSPGKSDSRHETEHIVHSGHNRDIEAFFYRDTCCFGVQGHPEYVGYSQYACWFLDTIYELVVSNVDLELRNKVNRLKKDILETREILIRKPLLSTEKLKSSIKEKK